MSITKTVLLLAILFFSSPAALAQQKTAIDLRTDGRVITFKRKDRFLQAVKANQLKLSKPLHDKLGNTTIRAIVVPPGKTGTKYVIGVLIGPQTLPDDWEVTEQDFAIIRDFSTNATFTAVEQRFNDIHQAVAAGDSALATAKHKELRAIIAEAGNEKESTESYAGYLLAEFDKGSEVTQFSDLVAKYRSEESRSAHPFIVRFIGGQSNPWATPFKVNEYDELLKVNELSSLTVEREPATAKAPGYLKVWRGRSLVVIAERPGAPFDPSKYKGGLVEYLTTENSALTASFTIQTADVPFDRPRVPQGVDSAIAALDAQVDRTPELFSAPSPRLQTELLGNYQTNETAKEAISTLSEHQRELPETTLERAALLAFALEDYRRATEFVDTGLKASPGNKQLLAARGLIEYQQSLYPQALASFRQAKRSTPVANSNFGAALMSNEGLVQWGLGQTGNAETSLSNSIPLFRGDDAKQQQAYLLLTQADFYVDYGQPAKALSMSEEALKLVSASGSDKQARIVEGRVHRLRAKAALFRGVINEAKEEIARAIKVHQEESSFLELAQDKDGHADLQELTGMHKDALKTLEEAAALYKNTNYIKGQSENQWKRANVLLALNRFDEAERLIYDASTRFGQLGYRKGLGDCEALRGVLILKRATHQYATRFHPDIAPQEKQAADNELVSQVQPAVERFESAIRIFQEIGYKRGIAYAEDKLAINLILQSEPSQEVFSRALQKSKDAAQTYEEIGDKRGQAVARGNLGIIFRKNKQYALALSNLETALEICKEIGFKLGIGRQLYNLGRAYYEKAESEKSEEEFLKAKNYFLEAQKVLKETQGGADELKWIDDYLKKLAEILR